MVLATSLDDNAGNDMSITQAQAQAIVQKLLPGHDGTNVVRMASIRSKGYSFTANARTYVLDLMPENKQTDAETKPLACFLTIAPPALPSGVYAFNTLPVIHKILHDVRTKTEIPLKESFLDTSLSTVPYHVLLSNTTSVPSSSLLSVAEARKKGLLSEKANLLIDLQLGKYLGQVHENVQNDWYGSPQLTEPPDPSYNWQETFTSLLEGLLSQFENDNVTVGFEIPFQDIRRYMSRAIGFFLFDDVEVPSFVWLTGSEEDIFLTAPSEPGKEINIEIAAILPAMAHAIWGDPLLESFFLPPGPTKALAEGYIGGGGGALILFPRQKTKRTWYDLFLGLLILYEIRSLKDEGDLEEKKTWCKKIILESVKELKDAPCF